ncbi:MAG: type II secretion system F family protein [Bryobacteraceae bacterium]
MQVSFSLFLVLFTWVLLSIALGLKVYEWWRRREMSAMLRTVAADPGVRGTTLLREMATGKRARLDAWLERIAMREKMESLIRQAGAAWTPGALLISMVTGALGGVVISLLFPIFWPWNVLVLSSILAVAPYLFLRSKRTRRLAAFEEHFPEALDFLARSMRAGHAFTISLKMVSEDLADPLGLEFRTLFNEQNLGAPLEIALYNLADRVPLLDLRFFVSAVILQKQTGGNLGEILTRLAHVIRERFRLKGQVKAASAHGRTTAIVLTIMPIATTILMMFAAPGYLQSMAGDPDGKWLIAGSIGGQIVGQLIIRKIIRIKV